MRTPKKGDEVKIKFADHAKNDDTILPALVYGRIHKVTEEAIVLDSWAHPDPELARNLSEDVESYAILRKVIESIHVVTEWKAM